MIHTFDQITDLAIVGLNVILPDGGGIDEFGRRIYRGLPLTGPSEGKPFGGSAAIEIVRQVCADAHLAMDRVPVISMSPSITPLLQDNGMDSHVQQVVGVAPALCQASDMLENGAEDVVLLVEYDHKFQTLSALLVAEEKFALDNGRPVLALIASAIQADAPLEASSISTILTEARRVSTIQPEAIGLILAASFSDPSVSPKELDGLRGAFGGGDSLTCALGGGLPGLLGIVKTVWCLSRRIIPCVPGWKGLPPDGDLRRSPFYVETESRAWFIPPGQNQRIAGLDLLAADGSFIHFLFGNAVSFVPGNMDAPRLETLHLFPFAAGSSGELLDSLNRLQAKSAVESDLAQAAQDAYRQYLLERPTAKFSLGLLGSTPDEIQREIGFAVKGIPGSIEKQADWQTPLGSYFTPRPLGRDGKVSFVYPGAFNSYPGIGRDLFYLYPVLFSQMSDISSDIGNLLNEQLVYARSLTPLTEVDLAGIEARLGTDPITMLISGSCLAYLYTEVLREVFEIHPSSAFGYSLGEVSMLFASRVWTDADETSQALRESPLFHSRLTGPQNAVREYWNLSPRSESDPPEALWGNFLLMTGPERVREALADEAHVYLTHINTPRQVVIGGEPAACRRVIDRLKCKSIQAPFNYAIHCEPIHSEHKMLVGLHSVPVRNQPGMTLYSSATFQAMPIDRQQIATQIADELCHCLDFPRLIQAAYHDGARIFIELGAGSNCARWVNDTLQGQPHAAYSINRKGVDDHTSILRLMARLVSQQIHLNLSVLYQEVKYATSFTQ